MKTILILGFLALASVGATVASGQTPILQYKFDETGTTAASTGLNSTPLTFLNASGTAVDLHSADGLGVSGLPGDRAFDNTASTGMGKGYLGGSGIVPPNTLGVLTSFTVQCWFKVSSPITNLARVFDDNRIAILAQRAVLTLYVNGGTASSPASYGETNEWVFMAVTYDGTKTINNVAFYYGTQSLPVSQVSTGSLGSGSVTQEDVFAIGNYLVNGVRPLDGLIDDFRVFGNASNSSGVLNAAQLEEIRQRDVTNEPDELANDAVDISGSIVQETGPNGSTTIKPVTIANVLRTLGIANAPATNSLRYYFDKTTQSYVIAPRSDALTGVGNPIATVLSPARAGVSWEPGQTSSIAAYDAPGLGGYLSGTVLSNGVFLGGIETDSINATLFGTISGVPTIMKCAILDVFNDGSALGVLEEPK